MCFVFERAHRGCAKLTTQYLQRCTRAGSAAMHFSLHLRRELKRSLNRLCAAADVYPPPPHPGGVAARAIFCDTALGTWAFSVVRTRSFEAPDNCETGTCV